MSTKRTVYHVQVIERAVDIRQVLPEDSRELGAGELGECLSLQKRTVHRLPPVLDQHELIRRNAETGRYTLGLRLFEFGTRTLRATAQMGVDAQLELGRVEETVEVEASMSAVQGVTAQVETVDVRQIQQMTVNGATSTSSPSTARSPRAPLVRLAAWPWSRKDDYRSENGRAISRQHHSGGAAQCKRGRATECLSAPGSIRTGTDGAAILPAGPSA